MRQLGHGSRIVLLWLVVTTVGMVLVAVFLAPILPPGTGSTQASGQRFDNEVLVLVSVAVTAMIIVYFGYALIVFRERDPKSTADGPSIRGNAGVQTTWVIATTLTVLFLAAFGSYELLDGAGGGQGSNPVFVPSASAATLTNGKPLQVQVIAQQWQFTFRYPSEGGFESAHFVVPVNREVELHVTSLDVIHSFWVPALGVKADANPGVDNVAYVTPTHVGHLAIHCAELCGLFHGYMFDNTARVVSQSAFAAWVAKERQFVSPVTHYLPAYSTHYLPDPAFRAG